MTATIDVITFLIKIKKKTLKTLKNMKKMFLKNVCKRLIKIAKFTTITLAH